MINKVVFGKIEGTTPARFYYDTRVLLLNSNVFPKFSRNAQKFIVYHEFAHADGIFNEEAADAYAFEKLIQHDHSLIATVEAVAKALPFHSDEGRQRIINQFNRAANYDFVHNGNKKANIELKSTEMIVPNNNNDFYAASMQAAATEYDFLGFGKNAKEKREQRQQNRDEKKDAKIDIKKAKAEAIRGGAYESGASKVLNNVVDGAKTFLGIGGGSNEPAPTTKGSDTNNNPDTSGEADTNKMPTWAWIAIAIVVLVLVYFLFFNKKAKK